MHADNNAKNRKEFETADGLSQEDSNAGGWRGPLETISKRSIACTTVRHMPTGSSPDNSMDSCHNEQEWRGTCSASPRFARRPIVVRGGACDRAGPFSLHRSDECEVCTRDTPPRRDRSDCHIPCPDTDAVFCVASAWAWAPQWPATCVSTTWRHARWRRRSQRPAVRRPLPPPSCASPRSYPDPSGSCPLDPPKTRLAHGAVGRLPLPIDATEFVARLG